MSCFLKKIKENRLQPTVTLLVGNICFVSQVTAARLSSLRSFQEKLTWKIDCHLFFRAITKTTGNLCLYKLHTAPNMYVIYIFHEQLTVDTQIQMQIYCPRAVE